MPLCVGIDVSKGKSTMCILAQDGVAIQEPKNIGHNKTDLMQVVNLIHSLGGKDDIRVVMEFTGAYNLSLLNFLQEHDIFVACINPLAMKKYRSEVNFRGAKTDKIDSTAIATYGINKWFSLKEYIPLEDAYKPMRMLSRDYLSYDSPATMLTQKLDHILDLTMPGIKAEFTGYDSATGVDRLSDFVKEFWHYDCITKLSYKKFEEKFNKWAKKKKYRPRKSKPTKIYELAKDSIPVVPADENTKKMVLDAVSALQSIHAIRFDILTQLRQLAMERPEYSVVRAMSGVGDVLAPLLIAEVGDPRRYHSSNAFIACVGIDVPPEESGQFVAKNKKITRKGSKQLRKLGYLAVGGLIKIKPTKDTAVYDFYNKKVNEGKAKKVAIVAAMNKFYRIYYARALETYDEVM